MLADEDLYDEFGNYLGEPTERPIIASPLEEHSVPSSELVDQYSESSSLSVVLHEEKNYYPSAEEIYGPDVEIKVEDEDRQTLSEPIIAPIRHDIFQVLPISAEPIPSATYTPSYLSESLIHRTERIRNVAITGALHHGKTSLLDMLVAASHPQVVNFDPNRPQKWTDTSFMSRERGISMSATPLTLILPNSKSQSFIMNFLDTPGHTDFGDEIMAALALCDGLMIVVDLLEGINSRTESILRYVAINRMPAVLFLNKFDRLILELRLPPSDAYHKIKHTIDEINTFLRTLGITEPDDPLFFSPKRDNVLMGSAKYGWLFSLDSYCRLLTPPVEESCFPCFWDDIVYLRDESKFAPLSTNPQLPRTFIEWVIEPIYKLHLTAIGIDSIDQISSILAQAGIVLKRSEIALAATNQHHLIAKVMQQYLGGYEGILGAFTDCIYRRIPSPLENAPLKIQQIYSGPCDSESPSIRTKAMSECDPQGPLMVYISKLMPTADAKSFLALGRVLSGTIRANSLIKVLGEHFVPNIDEEDSSPQFLEKIYLPLPMHNLEVAEAPAGSIVLLGDSIHNVILKTATIVQVEQNMEDPAFVFRRHFFTGAHRICSLSVIKLAIEPMHPSELPKMLDGLRNLTKAYPQAEARVEESGEHVLFGTGELYLDALMHDLRRLYGQVDIRVADPSVRFSETIVETSSLICTAMSPNNE